MRQLLGELATQLRRSLTTGSNLPHELAPASRGQSFFDRTSCKICIISSSQTSASTNTSEEAILTETHSKCGDVG
jgi:hypothetical protein